MKLSAVIFLASLSLTQATGWYPVNSKQEIPSEIVPYTRARKYRLDASKETSIMVNTNLMKRKYHIRTIPNM